MPEFFDLKNEFGFHPATEESRPRHEEVRRSFIEFGAKLAGLVPNGRHKSLMLTNLQQAAMWANAGIAIGLAPLED